MEHGQKLEEPAAQLCALVGYLVYRDGSFMPAVFFDVSRNAELAFRIAALDRTKRLTHIKIRFDEDGVVLLEAVKDLLDGCRLEDLVLRFVPEDKSDNEAFMGLLEMTHSWLFIIKLQKFELRIVISPDDDSVMFRYTSRRASELRKFKVS